MPPGIGGISPEPLHQKPMTRTAISVRQVAFEDLGSFEPTLLSLGFDVRYAEAAIDD